MRIIVWGVIVLSFCISCKNSPKDHNGKTFLVEVNGNFLYREDLYKALPFGLSKEDSVSFVNKYIHNWIKDVLLYDKAKSNIPNSHEIDVAVENYRRSLIIHVYQQELMKERLLREVPEQECIDFYDQNTNLFLLDFSLVKGLFIKVPITAPQLNDVRQWYKTETYEAVEKLEKYSFLNAVNYLYFYDKWMPVSEIIGYIPFTISDQEAYIKEKRQIEWLDNKFCYFLNVSEFCDKGEIKPYEFAKAEIKELLINEQQVDFMEGIKKDLYHQAEQRNQIIYNYQKEE
ncbi:hypothetical protein EZS27_002954 [termite gut metagenome]|uniref:Peptidyl-prolyl cis-trans isomerase n=1 Tax=termite gut metagenome TaxID=433724 RepID=A0A5J4STX5_9ZZZZ